MLNDRLNRAPLTRSARLATALALIAIALPLAGFGAAHQNQGAIAGTVVDQNGAPVPDAAIVLRPAGGEVRTFAPDANGRFDADSLPAGQYRIEVIAMGFAPLQESVTLSPDQRIERRFSLPLGSLEETIVVSGASLSSTTTTRPEAELQRDRTRWAATPLQPPIMVTHVRPEYPARLHDAGVQGVVTLQAQIGVDGAITSVSTVSAPQPELAEVARAAVQQWRYEPTRLHGVPVETRIKIVIEFTL